MATPFISTILSPEEEEVHLIWFQINNFIVILHQKNGNYHMYLLTYITNGINSTTTTIPFFHVDGQNSMPHIEYQHQLLYQLTFHAFLENPVNEVYCK